MTRRRRKPDAGTARLIDFTSSLYLGIRHPSRSLRPWFQFTTGKPAAAGEGQSALAVAEALAELQGTERVTLLPSTLHLFFDLFDALRHEAIAVYIDEAAYPIARWGAERAAARGVPLRDIPHYDADAAYRIIKADEPTGLRPVILADGFCPDCGRPAPLPGYLECVVPLDGYVALDDTQALGIWGSGHNRTEPYGSGGGGSLRLHELRSPNVIVGSSLAKGFGVSIAALGGSAGMVRRFLRHSETRVHASPPSIPALHAAEHALLVNAERGDDLRRRLAQLVARFCEGMHRAGLHGNNSSFPVQMLVPENADQIQLHRMLDNAGIRTALVRTRTAPGTKLVFVINASHTSADIDRAIQAVMTITR
jgi:8-amino-7-oxononanoate synthase